MITRRRILVAAGISAIAPLAAPTRLELVVNLRTAKKLGLEIPQSVLLRADKVIE